MDLRLSLSKSQKVKVT